MSLIVDPHRINRINKKRIYNNIRLDATRLSAGAIINDKNTPRQGERINEEAVYEKNRLISVGDINK